METIPAWVLDSFDELNARHFDSALPRPRFGVSKFGDQYAFYAPIVHVNAAKRQFEDEIDEARSGKMDLSEDAEILYSSILGNDPSVAKHAEERRRVVA